MPEAGYSQKQIQKQQQKLSPQQLQLLEMLSRSVDQIEEVVKREMESNPLIDPTTLDENNVSSRTDERPGGTLSDEYDPDAERDYAGEHDEYDYKEHYYNGEFDQRETQIAAPVSAIDDLHDQLRYRNLTDQQNAIANEILGSIDASGYLNIDLAVVVNDMYANGIFVTLNDVAEVLRIVQSLEPAGIAARTVQECLLLQLERLPQDDITLCAKKIVGQHFDLFKNRNFARLSQVLKADEKIVEKAVELVKGLSVQPLDGEGAEYVSPDFVVTQTGGRLNVSLADGNMPEIRFDEEYLQQMEQLSASEQSLSRSEKEQYAFLQEKKQSADGLIEALRQRKSTLLLVMNAIVDAQHDYFVSGNAADKRPLLQKDIAEATGFDPSTISRIVKDKYVQTDFGLIPLSQCFSTSYTNDSGEAVSTDIIKQRIAQMVEQEDKSAPLTDDQIAERLADEGYPVARRTVASYRKDLGIAMRAHRRVVKMIALLLMTLSGVALMAQQPMSYFDSIVYSRMMQSRVTRNTAGPGPAIDESQRTELRAAIDSLLSESDDLIDSLYDLSTPAPSFMWYGNAFSDCRVKPHNCRLDSLPDEIRISLVSDSSVFCFPVRGIITSPYGWRWNRPHRGTDIRLNTGDPVRCAFDGVVRIARAMGAYGNLIVVRHHNGLETVYGHLSKINVKPMQVVKAGNIIGLGGSTGRSTGPHLHFEVRFQYEPIDPEWILDFSTYSLRSKRLHLDKSYFGIRQPRHGDAPVYKADESHVAEEPEPTKESKPAKADKSKSNERYYVVQEGDTLSDIAQKFDITVRQLRQYNKSLKQPHAGDRLRVQ